MENLSQAQKLQRLIDASQAVIQEAVKPTKALKKVGGKYNPLDRTGPVWDAIFAFEKAEKAGQKSFKGLLAQTLILANFMKLTDNIKILKLVGQIGDIEGKPDDQIEAYLFSWHKQIINTFQDKYPKESQLMWGMGWQGPDV
jgi:hypothetical protein